jgi:hypothetical protein
MPFELRERAVDGLRLNVADEEEFDELSGDRFDLDVVVLIDEGLDVETNLFVDFSDGALYIGLALVCLALGEI